MYPYPSYLYQKVSFFELPYILHFLLTSYCSCLLPVSNASASPVHALQEKPLGNALESKGKIIYLRVVEYVYKSSPYCI